MPLGDDFVNQGKGGGHGEKVMRDMSKRYGAKKGKEVFYATANKRSQKPGNTGPSPVKENNSETSPKSRRSLTGLFGRT